MGVIRRQGIKNSIYNYLGVGLGYINMALIMTNVLSAEEYGLRGVIFRLGSFFSMAALLGTANIVNRYFPHFKNKETRHGDLLSFILTYLGVGIILGAILTIALKSFAFSSYSNVPFLLDYYYEIIPFGASLALFEALSAYCRVLLKSTVPVFVREVGVRILTTILLGLLAWGIIDFNQFFLAYLYSNTVGAFVLAGYLVKIGEFNIKLRISFWRFPMFIEMVKFGTYTMFNASINMVVRMTDMLMITYLMVGLAPAGIYDFGMLIANIVMVPATSLRQIASPIVADAFKRNDMKQLADIYNKTSTTQLVAGLFIFCIVVLNLPSLLLVMKSDFAQAEYVVYLMGITRIFDMASGMNNRLIMESKYYRATLVFNLILMVLVILTNWWFIPIYGITGAALASAISVMIIILAKIVFVYRVFGFNPYDFDTVKSVIVAVIALGAIYFLPIIGNVFVDIGYRTTLFVPLYIILVYKLKISEDINKLAEPFVGKVLGSAK
ncbi:MAG: polysaccharide biosynthesis C-terminal domain-containing protein [Bacteroidetes bacterium]|nr:polysaccharide biosynthesis C-terminal domain-containing protein [Bacteroidota bacterium]